MGRHQYGRGRCLSTLYQAQGNSVVGTVSLDATALREFYIVPSHKKVLAGA